MLHRRVNESLHLGEADDVVKLTLNISPLHSENRAIQEDVFSSGELRMKSGANFEQRSDASVQIDLARGWLGDARENFEQRTFAGAIASNDSNHLALLHFKRKIPAGAQTYLSSSLGAAAALLPRQRATASIGRLHVSITLSRRVR